MQLESGLMNFLDNWKRYILPAASQKPIVITTISVVFNLKIASFHLGDDLSRVVDLLRRHNYFNSPNGPTVNP